MRRLAVTSLLLLPSGLLAQGTWVGPQPPCDIGAGHFRVSSAVVNLKIAVEKPAQRDRMLAQTLDVLRRAITQDRQDRNPAAWYYLGRYYVEQNDALGADSAFDRAEALAPQCRADILGHRRRVWTAVFNDGVRAWQEGREDSAVALLGMALTVVPDDPRTPLTLGRLWAARSQSDSAVRYLRRAVETAGPDTAFARERREALAEIGRLYVRRAQDDPALQRWQRIRYSRDSLERAIANDSIILSRIVASSASRRARGTRLSPQDQQVFARDSAGRAQSLARGREARAALARQAATDSAALVAAFEPALEAYRTLLETSPTSVETAATAATLAALYAQSARPDEAARVFDRLAAQGRPLDPAQLFEAGRRLAAAHAFAPAARALTLGLEQNPYHRDALVELARTYVELRDSARAVSTVRRLLEVDPLNRTALRLAAAAWDLARVPDSTLKYLRQADSTLTLEIGVTVFQVEGAEALLGGGATNLASAPSRPLRLVVEFLDARGGVVAAQPVDIPPVPAGGTYPFEARASGPGIVAWRYRPS
ncbi:MAG TPA: hypothetical protein VNI61_12790 [Gemmatimonadales bacterium]|nr:hypothetical protein [Gemmatimonadales bacterium]